MKVKTLSFLLVLLLSAGCAGRTARYNKNIVANTAIGSGIGAAVGTLGALAFKGKVGPSALIGTLAGGLSWALNTPEDSVCTQDCHDQYAPLPPQYYQPGTRVPQLPRGYVQPPLPAEPYQYRLPGGCERNITRRGCTVCHKTKQEELAYERGMLREQQQLEREWNRLQREKERLAEDRGRNSVRQQRGYYRP